MWIFEPISNALARLTLPAWALLGLVAAYSYEHGIQQLIIDLVSAVLGRDETFFRALVAIAIAVIVARYVAALLTIDYVAERRVREAVEDEACGSEQLPHGDAFRAASRPLRASLLRDVVAELKVMFPRAKPTPDTRAAAETEVRRIMKKAMESTHKDLRKDHAAALGLYAVALLFVPTDDELAAERMIQSYTAIHRRARADGVAPDFLELLIRTWLSIQSQVVSLCSPSKTLMERSARWAKATQASMVSVFGRSANGDGASQQGASRGSSEHTPLLGSESTAPV